jgi:hypothetical protein
MYAWYSQQMADQLGTCFYQRSDGSEVEVTAVSPDPTKPFAKYPDLKELGEVVRFWRAGKSSAWSKGAKT